MRTILIGVLWVAAVTAVACGGGGKKDTSTPGEGHDPAGGAGEASGGAQSSVDGDGGVAAGEPGSPEVPVEPPKPVAPVTFVFNNVGKTELAFVLDKGWGSSVFAYSGKPPKAKTVLVFPKYCTGACDGSAGEACPICKEAETPKDRQAAEKAETNRQLVQAGGTFPLEGDGPVPVYGAP